MKVSELVIRAGKKYPRVTKSVVTLGAKIWLKIGPRSSIHNPHWLAKNLVRNYFVRVPVKVSLANGIQILVPWCDQVGEEIAGGGGYEPDTQALLQKLLKPGMTVFDIGAHAGIYSLHAARLVGDTGMVHSFEAEPVLADWIRRSARLNDITNIAVSATVLSDEVGEVSFYHASDASVNSLVKPRAHYGFEVVTMPSTTLSSYLEQHAIEHIDLIKIDVEGAELDVLGTIKPLLCADTRPVIIVEFAESRASLADLADFLLNCGYALYKISADKLLPLDRDALSARANPDQPADAFNALAVSPEYKVD